MNNLNNPTGVEYYKYIDRDSCMRLVTGIIRRAKDDYIRGKYRERKDVEKFMKSEYYYILTDLKNGGLALAYWEEKRREELGEGDVTMPDKRLFLIEGIATQRVRYDKLRRQQIIISAEDEEKATEKAIKYGIMTEHEEYKMIELKGVTELKAEELNKSKTGLIVVKSELI